MKKGAYKMKLTIEQLQDFAGQVNEAHGDLVSRGYTLMGSSGFWRTKRSGFTARLVYRLRGARAGDFTTITYIVRNIAVA